MIENFEISNKVQALLDYVCSEIECVEDERYWAERNHDYKTHHTLNNSWKGLYSIQSIALSIRNDVEAMEEECIKIASSDECLPTESDNA